MLIPIIGTVEFEEIILERGKGSWLWDVDGKRYLDCESGCWCTNLGHGNEDINQAAIKQMNQLLHTGTRFLANSTISASENLCKLIGEEYGKATFLNSGSESVEFAIHLAKLASRKKLIVSISGGYLGAYGTASKASGTTESDQVQKLPLIEISKNCIKIDQSPPICQEKCLDQSKELITDLRNNNNIACFVFESILVTGGVHKPCSSLVKAICSIVRDQGGYIIANEVTTGFGRTGKLFGYMHHDIKPDIIALGKALGNGFPVSAVFTTSVIEDKATKNGLVYAQSHQLDPFGAAIANAVISKFKHLVPVKNACKIGNEITNFLKELKSPFFKEIRSYGLTIAIEIINNQQISSDQIIDRINDLLLKDGIIIGFSKRMKVLRILPPLIWSQEELNFFIHQFSKVINKISIEFRSIEN